MYLKIHQTQKGRIIAACDKELIGKKLEEGKLCLDLEKYSGFYKGELVTEEKLEKELDNFFSVNLVGKKSVGVALRKKLINEDNVQFIKGFPFIQIYRI
ncbi:DUF424 family protein [Candidatus Micrarchaeota archaeon]|nr:DUF424 family protein [Candidatus Micrarchaeota archaeon]